VIHDELYCVSENLRRANNGDLGADAMSVLNARDHILNQESYIQRLKAQVAELEAEQGIPMSVRRIARAVEQAAMRGWGNVNSENLV
jgi:hypothetical protein